MLRHACTCATPGHNVQFAARITAPASRRAGDAASCLPYAHLPSLCTAWREWHMVVGTLPSTPEVAPADADVGCQHDYLGADLLLRPMRCHIHANDTNVYFPNWSNLA